VKGEQQRRRNSSSLKFPPGENGDRDPTRPARGRRGRSRSDLGGIAEEFPGLVDRRFLDLLMRGVINTDPGVEGRELRSGRGGAPCARADLEVNSF